MYDYSQFSEQDLRGLTLLAQERMRLAETQYQSIAEHITEQQQIMEELKARWERDNAWLVGLEQFLTIRQQQAAFPQQGAFAPVPTHQFSQLPAPQYVPPPAAPHFTPQFAPPPQQPVQQRPPVQLGPAAPPYPMTPAAAPPVALAPAPQGPFPGNPGGGVRVMERPEQPYNAQAATSPAQVLEQPERPYPNGPAPRAPFVQVRPEQEQPQAPRRSHLIPGTFTADPSFVDEYGLQPATEITDEMRAQWAKEGRREVHVFQPGEPGHVPEGGAGLIVKRAPLPNGAAVEATEPHGEKD